MSRKMITGIESPQVILKPWGWEKLWANTDKYAGKMIHIYPGHQLSLQYHEIKDETIYVLSGVVKAYSTKYEVEHVMSEGMCWRIYPGAVHRFAAPKNGPPVVLLEVSTPELDDVVRLEDDYGRIADEK